MRRSRKGFTLIELMAALGVTAVIGYFFISIGSDFVIAWDHVGDSVARETEARGALDIIARDFESAFFREGDDVMFAVDVLGDDSGAKWEGGAERPIGDGFDPVLHEYGWAGSWVRMFSAAPSFNAVGYRIIRTTIKNNVGDPRYMLYRNVATMENTILEAEAALVKNEAEIFDFESEMYLDGGYVLGTTRENILAVNVVDFGVRLYIYDSSEGGDPSGYDAPDGLRLIFPEDGSSGLASSIEGWTHRGSTYLGTAYVNRYPDVVEVFLRVLNKNGANELLDLEMEETIDDTLWEEIVEKNSRLYHRYITVGGRGGP
jgi:prepilin-type N-terminal cleavage/methylation domain-containing protein|tara:strand:+ start:974 stop:1924 length:951 start_codon:yes stop_codon:yes gene_type:complete